MHLSSPLEQPYLRILHLEDDPVDAEIVEANLAASGTPVSITRVLTEKTFRTALQRAPFDVIISDSKLPGFDTFRALEAIQRGSPEVPFIFFSGNSYPPVKERALAEGATDYVDKGDPDRLVTLIRSVLRGKERRRDWMPPIERAVMVRGHGFRCLAFQDSVGKWRDYFDQQELPTAVDRVELD